jgi:hypothetical protein
VSLTCRFPWIFCPDIAAEGLVYPPEMQPCDGPRPCLITSRKAMKFRANPDKKNDQPRSLPELCSGEINGEFR